MTMNLGSIPGFQLVSMRFRQKLVRKIHDFMPSYILSRTWNLGVVVKSDYKKFLELLLPRQFFDRIQTYMLCVQDTTWFRMKGLDQSRDKQTRYLAEKNTDI